MLEKFISCDDWFYLFIDDQIIRTIHANEVADAPWTEVA